MLGIARIVELVILSNRSARRASDEAKEFTRRLEDLSKRLLAVQEEERRRIARELHDEVGQVLTAIKLELLQLRRERDPVLAERRLAEAISLVDGNIATIRKLALELRPSALDDLGLVPALREEVQKLRSRSECEITFGHDPLEERFPLELETACYRIGLEGVRNALLHAGARHIHLELRREYSALRLSVVDDGKGFVRGDGATAEGGAGLGLVGIDERVRILGGSVELVSRPGEGTRLAVFLPCLPRANPGAGPNATSPDRRSPASAAAGRSGE